MLVFADSPDAAEERELERLEELIRGSNKPLFAGDRVRYSEGRVEGVIQSITTLNDGRVTCKVRLDDDQENGEALAAAEGGTPAAEGDGGIVRTYFLQDLFPIPKVLWEPRRAHIKSLSKGAKSGHVSLGLEAGTLSLNSRCVFSPFSVFSGHCTAILRQLLLILGLISGLIVGVVRELCFATDDGWTTTSLPWHTVKGGATGVAINRKAVDIPASTVAAPAAPAAGGEPEPEPEPEPAAVGMLKTVVVLCTNRAICPRGKLEILLPEGLATEFESQCQAAAGDVAEWCGKLIAEDDARKQAALVEAGLATAAAPDGAAGAAEAAAVEGEPPTATEETPAPTAAAGEAAMGKDAAAAEAAPTAAAATASIEVVP